MDDPIEKQHPESLCLVYCVFATTGESPAVPARIDRQPVFLIKHNGLSAVVSRVPASTRETGSDIPDLLAYEKVIEEFFQDRAVLPMRYGSLLQDESQVIELLQQHSQEYQATLREVEGCVEMGIRIMVEKTEEERRNERSSSTLPSSSGEGYLQARRRYYAEREWPSQVEAALAKRCRIAFDGLFLKWKAEFSQLPNFVFLVPVLSLYFLVQRECEADFRRVFQAVSRSESVRMLLSGPWPPFNFMPLGQFEKEASQR